MNEAILILLLAVNCLLLYSKCKSLSEFSHKVVLIIVFVLHIIALVFYYQTSIENQKDSFLFYQNALEAKSIFRFKPYGSQLMSIIAFPFAKIGVSYLNMSILFGTISFLGYYNYMKFFNYKNTQNIYANSIMLFLLLLPSLHFWTAGFTKESIIFYAMSFIVIDVFNNQKASVMSVLLLCLLLFIRPYLFVILIGAYFAHYFFNYNTSYKQKVKILLWGLLLLLTATPFLLDVLNLDSLDLRQFKTNFNKIVQYSQNRGNSSIDLQGSNYLERGFLVLFRPMFVDAKNMYQHFISFENLIVMIVFFRFVYDALKENSAFNLIKRHIYVLATVLFCVLFYSMYMYNLGLASRMRVMFIPYMFIFLFLFYVQKSKKQLE